ncbi:MAG: hypothetical protein EAZ55_06095 [Cytophagales bacterium]|nr:MAG: hypothetical protein EAZ55_06095 [Cytophagales bacterium]
MANTLEIHPRSKAITSLVIFIMFCYSVLLVLLWQIVENQQPAIWQYIIAALCFLIAFPLNIRLLWNYKIIRFDDKKFIIWQPFFFRTRTLEAKDIINVEEYESQPIGQRFKQMKIYFPHYTLYCSNQEHTHYETLRKRMEKYFKKKQNHK